MGAVAIDEARAARAARRRRRRWPLRLLGWAAVVLAVLSVLRLAWGFYADRRLSAAIAERRAQGERVTWEELAPEPLADEENAAALYLKAVAAMRDPNRLLWKLNTSLAALRADAGEARQLLAANREPLRLVRAARDLHRTNWGTPWKSPAVMMLPPHLSGVRSLVRLSGIAMLQAQLDGDSREALEHVRDMLDVSARLETSEVTALSLLTRRATDALALARLETLLPELRIGEGEARAVTPNEVRALVRRLLDERELQEGAAQSLRADRARLIDTAEWLNSGRARWSAVTGMTLVPLPSWVGSVPDVAHRVLLGPAWKLDAARAFPYIDQFHVALATPSWPEARVLLPPLRNALEISFAPNQTLSTVLVGNDWHLVRVTFQAKASRRLAATALALRLYEVTEGTLPERLEALVPAYLDAVPIDPMSPEGAPLGYVHDAVQPRVYSVGEDERDDGGKFAIGRSGYIDPHELDQVCFVRGSPENSASLAGTAPATAPSTQAVGDDE